MKFLTGILVAGCVLGSVSIQSPGTAEGDGDTDPLVGEHSWSFSNTNDETPVSGTLRLGVMRVANDHYLCSGIFTVTDPVSLRFSVFGNMEHIDNRIRATLCLQGKRCEDGNCSVGIDMMTITMDPNTLHGTSEGIGVYQGATEHSVGAVMYLGRELPSDRNL